jgi:hypothetical protein
MNANEVETAIKAMGYTEIKRPTSNRLIVFMDSSERVSNLKLFASMFKGTYSSSKNGAGWRSSVGAAILPNGVVVIAKPQTKGVGGNIAALDARAFAVGAKNQKFEFAGQLIDVASFTSAKQIEQSIIEGARKSNLLGEPYAAAFEDFFVYGKISWSDTMARPVINKLGVYVGELLIGWAFFQTNKTKYFINNPFRGQAKAFHLPTDPSFSGVDSFIEMTDGSFYALSSKFGGGAKASFFTNLFEKGIKNRTKLSQSYFKKMCDFATSNNIPFNKSKDMMYMFGVREILGISKKDLNNPLKVFDDVKTGKVSAEVSKVIQQMKIKAKDPQIFNNVPLSISAFFTRTVAENLNKDRASINQMKEILAGKDYWQANLDVNSWLKGEAKFKFINSGEASLNIIGSKSAITDITSKQGWVNYELKY